MRKKGKKITWDDRQRIEQLTKVDMSIAMIAKDIGVSRTAIYYELARGGEPYSADYAQKNVNVGISNDR